MRCPSCNKFPAFSSDTEPEVEVNDPEHEIDPEDKAKGTVVITGTARIVLTTECCGDDVKECTFDIEQHIDVEKSADCKCEGDSWIEGCSVEADGAEITDRQQASKPFTYKRGPKKGQTEQRPIPSRYQKRFYGVKVELAVSCGCRKAIGSEEFTDEVQASSMDEI